MGVTLPRVLACKACRQSSGSPLVLTVSRSALAPRLVAAFVGHRGLEPRIPPPQTECVTATLMPDASGVIDGTWTRFGPGSQPGGSTLRPRSPCCSGARIRTWIGGSKGRRPCRLDDSRSLFRVRGSNSDRRLQRPRSYHWTNPDRSCDARRGGAPALLSVAVPLGRPRPSPPHWAPDGRAHDGLGHPAGGISPPAAVGW